MEWHIYQYHFVDEIGSMKCAYDEIGDTDDGPAKIRMMGRILEDAGWEGDGTIRLLWLPPFVLPGEDLCFGEWIWHVKQSNNGTSWIASPIPLPYPELESVKVSREDDFRGAGLSEW
jgi:hypothetical protein